MMPLAAAFLLLLLGGIAAYIALGGPKLPPETDAIIERVMNNDLPERVNGETGYATSDGLKIWYESIAPPNTPEGAVLLITGSGSVCW